DKPKEFESKDDFVKWYKKLSLDDRNNYVSNLKESISKTNEDFQKNYEEARKSGLSDQEAQAKALEKVPESYAPSLKTIQTLEDSGVMRGGFENIANQSLKTMSKTIVGGLVGGTAFLADTGQRLIEA